MCEATRESALHQAATFNHTEIVKLLLEAGANPNAKADFGVPTKTFWRDVPVVGETPLHRAAGFSSQELIALLHEAGADKNQLDANGQAALTWYSHSNRDRMIELTDGKEVMRMTNPDAWGGQPRGRWQSGGAGC